MYELNTKFTIEENFNNAFAFKPNLTISSKIYQKIYKQLITIFRFKHKFSNTKKFKKNLNIIIANLANAYFLKEGYFIFYTRDANNYKLAERYNPHKLSYRPAIRAIKFLITASLISHKKGFFDHDKEWGKRSRMRASPGLIEILKYCGLEDFNIREQNIESIRLKDEKKQYIDYEDTEDTREMRYNLIYYNNLLSRSKISILFNKSVNSFLDLNPVNFKNRQYHRTFNNRSWKLGGRYFGPWWQSISGDLRKFITINHKTIVELDYSSLHTLLLYGLKEINYYQLKGEQSDPYILKGFGLKNRKLVKDVVNIALNMKTKKNFMNNIKNALFMEGLDQQRKGLLNPYDIPSKNLVKKIIESFEKEHPLISNHLFTGVGLQLMNTDSSIAEYILKQFVNKEIPVLCIHDSFMVNTKYESLLREIMVKSFKVHNLISIPKIKNK